MLKYIFFFFSVTFFLTACNSGGAPDGVIGHKKMVSLLIQVHLVDGGLYAVSMNPDSLYKYGTARYQFVFKKFGVDSAQFRKSLQYYAVHPTEFSAMYQQIADSMKQKTDSITKETLLKRHVASPK